VGNAMSRTSQVASVSLTAYSRLEIRKLHCRNRPLDSLG
jgi:hypothetical protein